MGLNLISISSDTNSYIYRNVILIQDRAGQVEFSVLDEIYRASNLDDALRIIDDAVSHDEVAALV